MPHTFTRDRTFWTIALQVTILNFYLGGFGPAQPLLRADQGTSLTIAGLHGTAMGVAAIFVLAAQGTFATASDAAGYLTIAVAAVTGFLSIVKHVALNHGGDIKVWSREGVGSTFTLQLPIAQTVRGVTS